MVTHEGILVAFWLGDSAIAASLVLAVRGFAPRQARCRRGMLAGLPELCAAGGCMQRWLGWLCKAAGFFSSFFPLYTDSEAYCGVLQILGDGTVHVLTEKGVVPAQLRMPEVEGEFMDVCDIDTGLCTDAPQETAELLPDNSGKADTVCYALLLVFAPCSACRLALRIPLSGIGRCVREACQHLSGLCGALAWPN